MTVKTDVISAPDTEGADKSAAAWWEDEALAINGRESARILGWDNPNSVRNRAREGGFRWKRKGNRQLVFHRGDVEEYKRRFATSTEG